MHREQFKSDWDGWWLNAHKRAIYDLWTEHDKGTIRSSMPSGRLHVSALPLLYISFESRWAGPSPCSDIQALSNALCLKSLEILLTSWCFLHAVPSLVLCQDSCPRCWHWITCINVIEGVEVVCRMSFTSKQDMLAFLGMEFHIPLTLPGF